MLKNILKLNGANQLTNTEQKSISGGKLMCYVPHPSGEGYYCRRRGRICAESICAFEDLA